MISDMITRYDNAKTDMRAIIDCNTDYTLNMKLFGAYKEIIKRRFVIYRAKKDLSFVKEKIQKMIDGCDDDSKFLCLITVIHKILHKLLTILHCMNESNEKHVIYNYNLLYNYNLYEVLC